MEAYQQEYIVKLSARVDALKAAKDALKADPVEAATSARRIAHTLRGSGKTYGFPQITELAAVVEECPSSELAANLHNLILYLRFLLQKVKERQESVLIVDDSDEVQLMLGTILTNQGYAVAAALTASAAEQALTKQLPSIIILDLVLPDTDGRNFLIKLKENFRSANIPVLVLSAKSSSQTKAECFALGADEYFEKPIDMTLLTTSISKHVSRAKNVNQETRKDELTGLPNRAAFNEHFGQMERQARSEGNPLTLAMLDLDLFKSVNDKHGHLVGDEVLRFAGETIQAQLGESDILARWGGEEFALLMPNTDPSRAKAALETVLNHLESNPYQTSTGKSIVLSFSAGCIEVDQNADSATAIGAADMLMYRAKEAGRRQVVLDSDDVTTAAKSILLAEDDDLTAEFIHHRLLKSGFELLHFANGDEACADGLKTRYDLIITDVKMPGMDGFELVQRIRQGSVNKDTPILMLTSMGRDHDIARGLGLGANDYMLKPFSPTELLARVGRLLK